MMFKLKKWIAAVALTVVAGAAPAALVLQANNVEVLDTDTSLLWLYNWHWEPQPLQTWPVGTAWAAGLTTGGAAAGQWRLPTLSEFEDLWADPLVDGLRQNLANHFIGVDYPKEYWTSAASGDLATVFSILNGSSVDLGKDHPFVYVVAVRSAATGPDPRAVPEPHSAALALLGLGAVALHRRRPGAARVGANKFPPTAGA